MSGTTPPKAKIEHADSQVSEAGTSDVGDATPFDAGTSGAETIETWDAGHMGCGELVILLRARLKAMPGGVLRVIAQDAGAPEDLPAWCRMTRNTLLHHAPETHSFWIQSRTDWA
ncbi:sulfurtransferase TusA family protein [Aquabacter sp. P-9]|uniref:sulfurtransferase TusA family protein n=1 Tax=Aquabacter sediminis TaxID=3029197 RepID=UPI00237E8F6D|nr:sulfurtransferase TusA family protein [Aquabacter sp. P-9]MDE1567036.1 sulfurtransferase TusA family protein [Aquabacter sp. P-9]